MLGVYPMFLAYNYAGYVLILPIYPFQTDPRRRIRIKNNGQKCPLFFMQESVSEDPNINKQTANRDQWSCRDNAAIGVGNAASF